MSPRDGLQKILRHTPSGLLVLAALLGFAYLTRGTSHSRGAFTAYAEAQVHMVAPMLAGRVKAVHVQLGQRVKQGDVIALMDDRAVQLHAALGRPEEEGLLQRLDHVIEADLVRELRRGDDLSYELIHRTVAEIAEHLGISDKTVQRDWLTARAWLRKEVARDLGLLDPPET